MAVNGKKLSEYIDRLEASPRPALLNELLDEAIKPSPVQEGVFNAIGLLIADSIFDHDQLALDAAIKDIRRVYVEKAQAGSSTDASCLDCGRLLGYIDVVHHARLTLIPLSVMREFDTDSHMHRFLKVLSNQSGWSNASLARSLDIDETEVSRVGKRLVEKGLARKRRVGRKNSWEITPRGRHTLELVANHET